MKRKNNGEYIPCLKYSVPIFVEYIYKMWIIQEPNVIIMKQTAFWREKNGEYIPCLKYSVTIFVEYICKCE